MDIRPLALALGLALAGGAADAQTTCGEPLTLRISDAITRLPADGSPPEVAVVVRTYASRPVGQGQIDLRAGGFFAAGSAGSSRPRDLVAGEPEAIFAELVDATIFASADDADVTGSLADGVASLAFLSPTATVNDQDGPLAVYRVRLTDGLTAGTELPLDLVLPQTHLVDGAGNPVAVTVRGGDLLVVGADAPYALEADGDDVVSGQLGDFDVETQETFPITAGTIAVTWDPAVAHPTEPPVVRMDPRHGLAEWTIVESVPGRLVVSFTSPDASLNRDVPGAILQFGVRMADGQGATPLRLDPAATELQGEDGLPLTLQLFDDEIVFDGSRRIFSDAFECGGTGAWSGVVS